MSKGNNGVDFEKVYDQLYDEILYYVINKSTDFTVITLEDIEI